MIQAPAPADPEAEEIRQKLQPLLKRNYESMELLAPMEIRLNLDKAKKSVIPNHDPADHSQKTGISDVMCQVRRDPKDPDRSIQTDIPDIFSQQSKLTCLSKYKKCTYESTQIKPKLAICICSYNEGKGMLKESLDGVYDSLETFQKVAGINSEQIVVTVIFDGIENVKRGDFDEDILTMFDEYDYRNGSILREGQKPFLDVLEKDRPDSINHINWSRVSTYKPEEIAERTSNRFRTRYNEYMSFKKLEKICLDTNHPIDINKVPLEVRNEYLRLKAATVKDQLDYTTQIAMQKYKENIRLNQEQQVSSQAIKEIERKYVEKKKKELEDKFEMYTNQKNFMEKAYSNVLDLTRKYFKTRQDTTLIYPMRYVPSLIEKEAQEAEEHDNHEHKPVGLNVLLCVKHRNAGKLSSHALFFLGFCEFMQPELCLLLDVGLKPLDNSIFEMYKYMDCNERTGGTCGYMGLRIQRSGDEFGNVEMDNIDPLSSMMHNSLFSIQRAQMFEYHFGHLIDKPFEAAFNFIHVLPGAFSCYRYSCLRGEKLMEYLSPVLEQDKERSLEEQNRYLAEDRTLSLVLKAKGYDFAYIPTAKAVVDPAGDLTTLMGQRRRWINGSWFSFFYVISERHQIKSCATHFQFWYYILIQGVSYVSIGLFFAALYISMDTILTQYITQPLGGLSVQNQHNGTLAIVMFIYVFAMGSIFFLSLQVKNNDKKFQSIYYAVSTFLGLYGCLIMALMVVNLIDLANTNFGQNLTERDFYMLGLPSGSKIPLAIGVMMVANFAVYILHVLFSFSFRIIWEVMISTPSYLFYAPTYLHILVIYAFCKIDDFSWGTKGLQKTNTARAFLQEQNKIKKYKHVSKFLFWNCLVAITFTILIVNNTSSAGGISGRTLYMLIFSGFLLLITIFKFVISIGYLIKFYLCSCCVRYTEDIRARNERTGNLINEQVSRQLSKLKERYVSQTTELLRKLYSTTVSKIRVSKMSIRRP